MVGPVDGILFDLGNTLVDFAPVSTRVLYESGARNSYDYLKEIGVEIPSFAGYRRRQIWRIRWHYIKSRATAREFNSLEVIRSLADDMDHHFTPEDIMELAWLWYKPLRESATVEKGLAGVLERLRDAGLKLGIVSNTFVPGRILDRHLDQEGLLEFFPVRVYSCDVRFRKPDRRIFKIALRRADLQARRTVFVGDSPRADVIGANRVGMISVLKDTPGLSGLLPVRADHRIRKLAELEDVVRQYQS